MRATACSRFAAASAVTDSWIRPTVNGVVIEVKGDRFIGAQEVPCNRPDVLLSHSVSVDGPQDRRTRVRPTQARRTRVLPALRGRDTGRQDRRRAPLTPQRRAHERIPRDQGTALGRSKPNGDFRSPADGDCEQHRVLLLSRFRFCGMDHLEPRAVWTASVRPVPVRSVDYDRLPRSNLPLDLRPHEPEPRIGNWRAAGRIDATGEPAD